MTKIENSRKIVLLQTFTWESRFNMSKPIGEEGLCYGTNKCMCEFVKSWENMLVREMRMHTSKNFVQLQFLLRKKIVVSAIILLDTLTSTCCHTTNCCCSDDTFTKLLPLEHALGVLARTLTGIGGLGQTASFSIVYFLFDTLLCSLWQMKSRRDKYWRKKWDGGGMGSP